MLAAALAPAYLRVSGTWANATYFADGDDAPPGPPAGFTSVLSWARWRAVIDFAKDVDAQIVTSFAVSAGTRDAAGLWAPDQARRLLAYTRSLGASVAAAEFMNEPTLAASNGAPAGYDAKSYGRDFKVFRELAQAGVARNIDPRARLDRQIFVFGGIRHGDRRSVRRIRRWH